MRRALNTIIVLVPLTLLVWVGYNYVDLDGQTTVVWEPGDQSAFVHGFRPTGRVTAQLPKEVGEGARLHGDPIYLSVTPPGNYETVDIKTWINPHDQPMVELGATVNSAAGQIDLRPLVHQTLDSLDWTRVKTGDISLWQRNKVYDSVEDFLDRLPERSSIATYHYKLDEPDEVPTGWAPGSGYTFESASLRGFHEFVTATDGRDLDLEILYSDMNRNPGEDPVAVRVFQEGMLMSEVLQDDDGIDEDSNVSVGTRVVTVSVKDLRPGVLKVELNAGTDVYWRKISSSTPSMSFLSNVNIGDEVGYLDDPRPVTLYTDAQHLTLFTRHAEGVQKVTVAGLEVDIAIPHERYNIEQEESGIVRVDIPRGDLVVVTDGVLAFSQDAFFNPMSVRLDDRTDLDKLGVDYVIARYDSPEADGDWRVASTRFELGGLEREVVGGTDENARLLNGSLRFVVSLPHVTDRGAYADIGRLEMTFERPKRTVWDVLTLVLNRFYD